MKKFLNSIIIITLLYQVKLMAQEIRAFPHNPSAEIVMAIESQMSNKYGKIFYLDKFFIMDTLINKIPVPFTLNEVKDPYGKLNGINIFTCQDAKTGQNDSLRHIPDSTIIGIFKNGNVLWDSGPMIYGNIESELSFCDDINADGTVDIGIVAEYYNYWNHNDKETVDYLWILSWNGTNGNLINDYDAATGKSKLVPKFFDLFDWDGDGIYEIESSWDPDDVMPENPPPNYPFVTYGWNGSKYGLWNSIYQLKWNDFYPARWITATVKCAIKKSNDKFYFEYNIANSSTSKQRIDLVFINNINTISVDDSSKYENDVFSSNSYLLTSAWLFSSNSYSRLIKPGDSKGGYWYIGTGLPGICDVYIQGLAPVIFDLDSLKIITDEMRINNIFYNSFKTHTIGLKGIPSTFNSNNIIDTIYNYIQQSFQFNWIKNQTTSDKYNNYFNTTKTQLQQNNIAGASATLNNVLRDVNQDSTTNLTSEAYALIRYNTEYLLANLPVPASGLPVKLVASNNTSLTTGSLQYYDGGWKDAVNNNDGTFLVNTTLKTVSLRMTYEYGTQTLSNVVVGSDTAIFRTVNTSVQLKDSRGSLIDTGTVQYYAGAWRDFGATTNGVANKELLPNTYSFRMSYAYASTDKQQNIGTDPNVIFQTTNAAVQLKNSSGTLMDQGTVQYYAGAWRDFGTTTNGVASKELLPNTYSFRMSYAYASTDKQQNIGTDPNVIFQTTNAAVQLKNSSGSLMDQGTVQYYAGAWRDFGTTTNGVANKELLPNTYSFRMTYAYSSNDKQQNIGADPNVIFQTTNTSVQLKNSSGSLMDQGTVQYYAGAWRDFGTTTNGVANKELLPNSYSFRMTYEYISKDITQNIGTSNTVNFSTVLCTVSVKDSQGNHINNADAKYYAGAWREIGLTSNGIVTKELLPASLSFRIISGTTQKDKTQDLSTGSTVEFTLP